MSATKSSPKGPATILVVQQEEVFSDFLQHFPAGRYALLYAAGPAEAMALCETRKPKLLILPTGGACEGLAEALAEVSRVEAPIIGLVEPDEQNTEPPPKIDRLVAKDDIEAIVAVATELVNERRKQPRVVVEFPVRIGEEGAGVARDLSASFLQINTREKVTEGQELEVEIGWGDEPKQFKATVTRVQSSMLGEAVVVLEVEDVPETREYLDRLVRKILEVEHYLQGTSKRVAPLRGPMAWKLARRTEDALRDA